MVSLAREAGGVAVLITAPTAIEPGFEPSELGQRWLHDRSQLAPIHRRYADAVREVAAEEAAPLCDLAARFDAIPGEVRRATHFLPDGMHFAAAGDEEAAAFLLDCFTSQPELVAALQSRRR